MIDLRRHLSVPLAAARLGVSCPTLRRWVKAGMLPGVVRGSRVLIHPDDLGAFVKPARVEARPALSAEGGGAAELLKNLGVG
jgi:excisionase family DNA binding protein